MISTKKATTVDQYISTLAGEPSERMELIRRTIKEAFPDITESIRYNMPAFCLNNIHIYFSAYKHHIGMYAVYAMDELEEKIKPYRGKGTKDSLHFLHKERLPLQLIIEIARFKFNLQTD